MANILQIVAQALKGLNPRKPRDASSPSPSPLYAPPTGPQLKPIGLDGDVKKWMGGIEEAQGVLNQPAPKLQSPKVDPLESALSVFLAGSNPFAASKTLETPGLLAQGRADSANQQALLGYQQNRENAQSTIGTNTKLIDMALDRDAVAERVAGQLRAKELEGVTRREIASLQQNTQLLKTLANLEATGGITVPAVSAIYAQMGYQYEDAQAIATKIVEDIARNPSLKFALERAKVDNSKAKNSETELKRMWDDLQNPNATYAERYQIARKLQQREEIDPNVDLGVFLEQVGAQTQNAVAGANLKDKQADLAESTKKYRDELTKVLPSKAASDLAYKYAAADHLRNLDQQAAANFDFKQKIEIQKAMNANDRSILTSLQGEYGSITNDINSLRTSRRELEKKLLELQKDTPEYKDLAEDIAEYDRNIKIKLERRTSIQERANEVRSRMAEGEQVKPTETPTPQTTAPPALYGGIGQSGTAKKGSTKKHFTDAEKRKMGRGGKAVPVRVLPGGVTK